ncbi:MAG TPA: restriction endonuclease [Firmicutes bacterium]|nr:restriction endonuclease [Bacillota bacterium]
MSIPGFQSLMLPLLKILRDGQEHAFGELVEVLSQEFHLEESEKKELLPSGSLKFRNRVAWARTYLTKARLIESVGRGRLRITQRGTEVLAENPPLIDRKYLERFPEYLAFRYGALALESADHEGRMEATVETPEEALDLTYQSIRRELAQDLLERVKSCSPAFFERLVVDLLVAMGYGGSRRDAGQAIGRSGDGGIDGIIKEDRLGLDVIYVQAKRWEGTVGRPAVQAFTGSLEGERASKGVMITTSQFSMEARDYAKKVGKKIVLIDGEQLAELMIDHNVGVTEVSRYVVKRVDLDYFDE